MAIIPHLAALLLLATSAYEYSNGAEWQFPAFLCVVNFLYAIILEKDD
jgi:hypothetical protein